MELNLRNIIGGGLKAINRAYFEGYQPTQRYNEGERLRRLSLMAQLMPDELQKARFGETVRHNKVMEDIALGKTNPEEDARLAETVRHNKVMENVAERGLGIREQKAGPPDLMSEMVEEMGKAQKEYRYQYQDWKKQPFTYEFAPDPKTGQITPKVVPAPPPEAPDPYALFTGLIAPKARQYNLNTDSLLQLATHIYPSIKMPRDAGTNWWPGTIPQGTGPVRPAAFHDQEKDYPDVSQIGDSTVWTDEMLRKIANGEY